MSMFEVLTRCGAARRGVLTTRRGTVQTPVFMPVGTRATVKAMSPAELEELGAEIILGNTYHLFLRPGMELMKLAGGLHKFSSWKRSILTDSGGFQVFSLATLRKMEPDGVRFASHIDGTRFFLGPRESMAIQRTLDSDIVMAFDECTPYPATFEQAEKSLSITTRWERMSREQPLNDGQIRFGIVQGSVYPELRRRAAESIVEIGFDGYAIGGVSVGASEPEMMVAIDAAVPYLPQEVRERVEKAALGDWLDVEEIRLRANAPLTLGVWGESCFLTPTGGITNHENDAYRVTQEAVQSAFAAICENSVYARLDEIRQGDKFTVEAKV